MIYLKSFKLLNAYKEHLITQEDSRKIYNSPYPLNLFPIKQFEDINFDNITIFYGGNGSGKTTLLNIIGEKLHSNRKSKIDKGNYFKLYVNNCQYDLKNEHYDDIKRFLATIYLTIY